MTMPAQPNAAPAPAPVAPPAAVAQTPPAAAAPAADRGRAKADRAAALKAKLDAEPAPEGSAEPSGGVAPAAVEGQAPAPAAAAVDDVATKRAQERLARIRQVQEAERAQDEERQRRRAMKDQSGEVEKLRARIAELEPLNKVFDSEEALLAYAESKGMSPEKLVQWMRTRMTDPAAVAQRHAKTEAEKIREELAAERKAREELERRLSERDEQTQAQWSAQQKTQAFLARAADQAADFPLSAAMLERHGAQGFVGWANKFVVPLLREDYTPEELHDYTEQLLTELQVGGPAPAAPATAAQGTSPPAKKNGAPEPSPTLSNALTSERISVAEEVPLHRLPKAERQRRLKDKLDRSE